jgi:transposase-like protein
MQGLPFDTVTQFIALGVTLVAGFFFGLAARAGRSKWRDRYQDEELRHRTYRDETGAELREAQRRLRELEAENARLRAATTPATPTRTTEPY